ncbi:MAG TPA: MDR family MFS transporter [Aliidongia sp.]|uniref:MDR family MFS transporter n=1 Tax=Aliidongia sp. TaxID=1914230 RepID=UPI002DDD7ED7|nr:MDR family MFS transporter [Aliidongia sp.]HEV2677087.1 MDR family MFS transporter [Aliidongia sp.]
MSQPVKSSRGFVVAAVMASMFMVAIEATIISTAMPQIVAELGGLDLYSWVFSSFLLTQTAMTVMFGKLSDLYGRKPVMLIGIAIFVVGSIFAGFAWSMPSMIVFRLIQGVGAGAVQPMALTIVADLYPANERGKVQGWLASVWAFSAVVGPLAGSLIIRDLSWAWVFWINAPIGLAAAVGFTFFLREDVKRQKRSIDYAGAGLFAIAIAALMYALTEAGSLNEANTLIAGGLFVVCSILFVAQERRAPDPMISFALWRRRPIAAANGATLLAGMALMGLTTFLPMYVQVVLQRSAIVAGLALTMMVLGWPTGATIAARSFQRVGLRRIMLIGSGLIPVGAIFFVTLGPDSSPVAAAAGSLVMGLGMGLLSVSSLVLIQEIVAWSQRGSVTASNIFARNLGSTIGATVFGAVVNFGLAHGTNGVAITGTQLQQLLQAPADAIAGDPAVRLALQHSLHMMFWAMLAVALIIALMVSLVPSITLGRVRQEEPAE